MLWKLSFHPDFTSPIDSVCIAKIVTALFLSDPKLFTRSRICLFYPDNAMKAS